LKNQVHPGFPWVEIQSAAVEVDRFLEVFTVAISSRAALDRRDFAVDAFGDTVRKPLVSSVPPCRSRAIFERAIWYNSADNMPNTSLSRGWSALFRQRVSSRQDQPARHR
jgi:hypothetical protein